jgi:hypothetical protein
MHHEWKESPSRALTPAAQVCLHGILRYVPTCQPSYPPSSTISQILIIVTEVLTLGIW